MPRVGDLVHHTDTGELMVWSGSAWVPLVNQQPVEPDEQEMVGIRKENRNPQKRTQKRTPR